MIVIVRKAVLDMVQANVPQLQAVLFGREISTMASGCSLHYLLMTLGGTASQAAIPAGLIEVGSITLMILPFTSSNWCCKEQRTRSWPRVQPWHET